MLIFVNPGTRWSLAFVSYSAVLEVCRRTGSWQRVSQLLQAMGTQRLPCSIIALNTAMLACLRSGLSEQVLRLFGDVKRQSLQPTSLTWSHVADALSHSPNGTVPLLVRSDYQCQFRRFWT
eukprot:s531_g13.t2